MEIAVESFIVYLCGSGYGSACVFKTPDPDLNEMDADPKPFQEIKPCVRNKFYQFRDQHVIQGHWI